MRIFTSEETLIREGIKYLRIVSVAYLFSGFSNMYLMVMRSVERVKLSTIAYAISLCVNVSLNACFIFGLLGFPKMGIEGVAIATCIARFSETLVCLVDSVKNGVIHVRIRHILHSGKMLKHDFWTYALPTMGNETVWSLGFSMFSVIIGHMGSDMVAAYSIVKVARNLGTVICFGVSGGTGVMIGKELGANRIREAELVGKRSTILTAITGVIGSGLILAARPILLHMGDLSAQAVAYLSTMLWISAAYVIPQSVNTTWICGVFRPGGDARFGLYCDIIDLWCVIIPLSAIAAFVLKLPPMLAFAVMCCDEASKFPFVFRRYRKKKWLKNITKEYAD